MVCERGSFGNVLDAVFKRRVADVGGCWSIPVSFDDGVVPIEVMSLKHRDVLDRAHGDVVCDCKNEISHVIWRRRGGKGEAYEVFGMDVYVAVCIVTEHKCFDDVSLQHHAHIVPVPTDASAFFWQKRGEI